jgi:hypothetical protein
MPFVASQVVGLIELDDSRSGHPLSEHRPAPRAPLASVITASDDDVIFADVRQLRRELRAELAAIIARLKRAARK